MTRDMYEWVDPWAEIATSDNIMLYFDKLETQLGRIYQVEGRSRWPDALKDIVREAAKERPRPRDIDFVPTFAYYSDDPPVRYTHRDVVDIKDVRVDAKTQDEPKMWSNEWVAERERAHGLGGRWGELAKRQTLITTGPLSSDPKYDRSVPIWLLAIIMLGIAFGLPALGGWIAAAMVDAGWLS